MVRMGKRQIWRGAISGVKIDEPGPLERDPTKPENTDSFQ